MTKFTQKSFTVAAPGTKEYADNWERTFRGVRGSLLCGACPAYPVSANGAHPAERPSCTQPPGHVGAHSAVIGSEEQPIDFWWE